MGPGKPGRLMSKTASFIFLCILISFIVSCVSAGSSDKAAAAENEWMASTVVVVEREEEIDGGYEKIDSSRRDAVEMFEWLCSELEKQGFYLTGESSEETHIKVVSGYKYRMVCGYRTDESAAEGFLLAVLFHRSDGFKEIQEVKIIE